MKLREFLKVVNPHEQLKISHMEQTATEFLDEDMYGDIHDREIGLFSSFAGGSDSYIRIHFVDKG